MTSVESSKIEKLDRLEGKVSEAIALIGELNARCQTLIEKNAELEKELGRLRDQNSQLDGEIVELKNANERHAQNGLEEKQILNKIDRMLEKFGELQI